MSAPALGGNNPPADATFALHIDDLFSTLSATLAGGTVDSDDKEAAIDGLMDEFRKAAKDADKERTTEKKPHLDAGKAVDAKWKPITEKADRGVSACKDALTPYRVEKQRKADAEAARLRAEAEAREAAAREALKASDDLEDRYEAEQSLKAASKATVAANKIARAPTGLRSVWNHEIVNHGELLRHLKERFPDELKAMLDEFVRRKVAAGARSMPGVSIIEDKRAA